MGQDNQVQTLMRQQKDLENQVQQKKEQIDDLERVRIDKDHKIVTLESELLKEKEKIHAIQHKIEKLNEENVKFDRNAKLFKEKEKNLEDKIASGGEKLEKLTIDNDQKQTEIDRLTRLNLDQETYAKQLKSDLETLSKEHNGLKNFNDSVCRENDNIKSKLAECENEIVNNKYKLREYEQKNKVLNRSNNQLAGEKARISQLKNEAEQEKSITKAGVNALTREIEHLRKQTDNEKTSILNLIRDRDMMQKYIKKAEIENH